MLSVKNVSFSYATLPVLDSLSFNVNKGEILGILGPNGSGKTTLMKLLGKTLQPSTGEIQLHEKNIHSFSNKEYAKHVAVLPQHVETAFSYEVKETVKMGRYAHQSGIFQTWTREDEQIVEDVLRETSLLHLKDKNLQQLSGGELQRVFLSRALAQQPSLLLLDEPTNHLDVANQVNLFDRLKKLKKEKDLTVIAIFHDLNLASLYCDRILLLHEGKQVRLGSPNHVLHPDILQNVYKTSIIRNEHPAVPKPQLGLIPEKDVSHGSLMESMSFEQTEAYSLIKTTFPIKTLFSSLQDGGFGWANTFVHNFDSHTTIETNGVVLTSEGNPSDAILKDHFFSEGSIYMNLVTGSTTNLFLFIDAELTERELLSLLTVVVQAKTRAQIVGEPVNEALNDQICIASSQSKSSSINFVELKEQVSKLVLQEVSESIRLFKKKHYINK